MRIPLISLLFLLCNVSCEHLIFNAWPCTTCVSITIVLSLDVCCIPGTWRSRSRSRSLSVDHFPPAPQSPSLPPYRSHVNPPAYSPRSKRKWGFLHDTPGTHRAPNYVVKRKPQRLGQLPIRFTPGVAGPDIKRHHLPNGRILRHELDGFPALIHSSKGKWTHRTNIRFSPKSRLYKPGPLTDDSQDAY